LQNGRLDPGLPHHGEVPRPAVRDFITTALRHLYADPDSRSHHPKRNLAAQDAFKKTVFVML